MVEAEGQSAMRRPIRVEIATADRMDGDKHRKTPDRRAESRYFWGKLGNAVAGWSTHPCDARKRLEECWTEFLFVRLGVPEHLREEYESIKAELTKRRRPKFEPYFPEEDLFDRLDERMKYTVGGMRKKTAGKLLERIEILHYRWGDWLHCSRE